MRQHLNLELLAPGPVDQRSIDHQRARALQDVYTAIITSSDVSPGSGRFRLYNLILMAVRFCLTPVRLVCSGIATLKKPKGFNAMTYVRNVNIEKWLDEGIYTGELKDGLPNGQGTYTSANGYKYVGEYKDGSCHGQGTVTHTNGDTYTGEWQDDKPHRGI